MNDVKRYDCTNGRAQHCYGCYQMTEGADGGYVESTDFDQVKAERDALQLLLNDRDEQLHNLEQSRRAEFDNGQAAERRIEDLQQRLTTAEQHIADFPDVEIVGCQFFGRNEDGTEPFEMVGGPIYRMKSFRMIGWRCEGPRPAETGAEKRAVPDVRIDDFDAQSDDSIPDFTPGNGNKARRRAEALKTSAFSDANEPPCPACFARGCNGECSGDGAMGD